jgi:hypothetical protein
MGRIVFGAVLLVLNFFLVLAATSKRGWDERSLSVIGPLTAVLAIPGLLLIYSGWRSRQPEYKPLLKGRHWSVVIGIALFVIHGLAVRGLFAGTSTWSTPEIWLLNTLLDIAAVMFLLGPILVSEWFEKADVVRRFAVLCGPLIIVTGSIITIEVMVNNRHRDALVAQLTAADETARIQAASALAKTGYRARIPNLAASLNDPSEQVRIGAVQALGKSESHDAIDPLIAALGDGSRQVQLAAIESLRAMPNKRDPRPVPALARHLDRVGGHDAARALFEYGGEDAEAALDRALARRDLAAVAGAWKYFLRKGEAGSEATLADSLSAAGDKEMAEAFLNCGNEKLASAAMSWAAARGYKIERSGGAATARWGSRK